MANEKGPLLTALEEVRKTPTITSQALAARSAKNTLPAVPVEGLDRYGLNWHDEMEPNSEGDYVLFSQSEANIAAELTMQVEIAQLRHLYTHLVNGTFKDVKELANGLLSTVIASLERQLEAKDARVKELEAENAALEKQALRDRSLANETHSDATLWQFSVDMGDHPSLLVKVWMQRKALETQLAAARKALEDMVSEYDAVDLSHDEPASMVSAVEVARAALESKP